MPLVKHNKNNELKNRKAHGSVCWSKFDSLNAGKCVGEFFECYIKKYKMALHNAGKIISRRCMQ